MLKNKKKLLILFPLLTLLVFCTFKYGETIAKYVSNSVWSYYLKTKEFYFSSDYLDINEKTNINKLWDGTSVHFNIKNSINQNLITSYDIEYDVTCEVIGDAASHTRCTLNGENDESWSGTLSSSTSCVNNTGDNVDVSSYTDEQCTTGGYTMVNDEFIKDAYFDVILTDQYYTISDVTVKITVESTNPYNKTIIGNFNLKKATNDSGTIIQEYKTYSNYENLIISNSYSTSKCVNITWDPAYIILDDDLSKFNIYNSDLNGTINNIELDVTSKNNTAIKFRNVDKQNTNDISRLSLIHI